MGDIPIERATLIHPILNKRTAREIRLSFPLKLLVRADEVIERFAEFVSGARGLLCALRPDPCAPLAPRGPARYLS